MVDLFPIFGANSFTANCVCEMEGLNESESQKVRISESILPCLLSMTSARNNFLSCYKYVNFSVGFKVEI